MDITIYGWSTNWPVPASMSIPALARLLLLQHVTVCDWCPPHSAITLATLADRSNYSRSADFADPLDVVAPVPAPHQQDRAGGAAGCSG